MKSALLISILIFLSYQIHSQNVGINHSGSAPDQSAILDLSSDSQGFLMPRLHKNERLTMNSPAQGLMVFDSTVNNLYFYRGNSWNLVGEDGPFKTFGSLIVQKANFNNDFIVGHPILPSTGPAVTENLFFFQESNGVFRAGGLNSSTDWHTVNIGDYSTAFGFNTQAKGNYSFSSGNNNESLGDYAISFGKNNLAEADYSMAIGQNTLAPSYGELALGSYNTDYLPMSQTASNSSDRALVIGNGNSTTRQDAFSVWKNGTVSMGHGNPTAKLDIVGEADQDLIKVFSNFQNRMRLMSDGKFILGGGAHYARIQVNAAYQEHAMQLRINGFQRFFVDSSGWAALGPNAPQAKLDVQAFSYENPFNVDVDGTRTFHIDLDGQIVVGDDVPDARLHINSDSGEDPFQVKVNGTQQFYVDKNGQTVVGENAPTARMDVQAEANEKALNVEINGEQKFFIDSDGQVAVGNAVPDSRLQVNANTGEDAFRVRINGTTKLLVDSNGGWSNYNATPTFAFQLENSSVDLRGRARAYSWHTYSDRRIKSNIRSLDYGLKDLMKLKPKSYQHHNTNFENEDLHIENDASADIGLIAQEVHEIIPEAVSKPANEHSDLWTMDYTRLVPLLIQSIQEQQEMIDELRREIEALKKN